MGGFFWQSGTVFPVHSWQFECMDKRTDKNQSQTGEGHHVHPLPREISKEQKEQNEEAHDAAEHDMIEDAELTASSPNDDLDEGETARLGEETDLI